MSSFTEATFAPTGETRNGRIVWRVVDGFRFDVGFKGSGLSVNVPAGFKTDGPSIPWWLLPFARPGCMVRAAAVHDRLREDRRFAKVDGDAIFLTAMATEGVPRMLRELAFLAVRLNRSRQSHGGATPLDTPVPNCPT